MLTIYLRCTIFILCVISSGSQEYDDNRWSKNSPWLQNQENNAIINEASYFIVASKMVRPGQIYRVAVTILQQKHSQSVRASIQRNGVEISTASSPVRKGVTELIIMKIPTTTVPGEYKLRIEGFYDHLFNGRSFINETILTFSQRSMSIFIQTDKPIYMQGQNVRFRAIPINTEMKAYDNIIDVYVLDPNGHIMRRWLSRQSNLGSVSLTYQLSDQPKFGFWTIQVVAQGQTAEYSFLVEEYYQTRFEVNVTMPAYFFSSDKFITGTVMANYTSGAPVKGNLTLKATIKRIPTFESRTFDRGYESNDVVERYFTFEEELPFWLPFSTYYDSDSNREVPHLRFFNGVYHFKYPMAELAKYVSYLDGTEITVTATVGDRFLDESHSGYSRARVYNSSVTMKFLGGSPQVFKPSMPFKCYIAVSYHDNSPLPLQRLLYSDVEITADVVFRSKGRRSLDNRALDMSSEHKGIWQFKVDLKSELGLDDVPNAKETLNDIDSMKIVANFRDNSGEAVTAELLLLSHYSPNQRQIKVSTSTSNAKVGEYIIFHVQSNFFLESFSYIIMSKGIILLAGQENINSIRTFAVSLSNEMAPTATILVYSIGRYGEVVADSMTFPVNGISRNNFTLFINNRKAKTGERVEVAVYGEPGSYIGLSGTDKAFYSMQAGNELTYAKVISKMGRFDEDTNGTYFMAWHSHAGDPDTIVHFPSPTYGIDANRTFEYSGLVVFSDVEVPRRLDLCNESQGLGECLNGRCYKLEKRCDGRYDCEDGTDESLCPYRNETEILEFQLFRFSRTLQHYENVWLWKDINIGAHGRYIFEVPVPEHPAHWMVSAFGMSPNAGFGLLDKAVEYMGVLPFYINVEIPPVSHQGEQIGVRVSVFNYMKTDIEAVVVLSGSDDYKFVHVGPNGIVRSYNPETSFGDHQFFIYIKAQDAAVVYLPIVPVKLGDIYVTVVASTLIAKDTVTKKLHVLADGLPQYRHQSILLDLRTRAHVFQYMHVNVTDTPIIPYDEDRYYIFGSNKAFVTVVGDVVGPIFPTNPLNATSLLNLPMECAEQTVFGFAQNMYTIMYMRLINQRNRTQEKEAFFHMNVGYQRALSFMNEDGSFSFFRSDWNHSSPSVWLTAFCARIFQEATFYEWENYIYIDPVVISKAVQWVLQHQTEVGSFYEVTWLADRKVNSSILWPNDSLPSRNITLTAHILIMLDTVKDLTGGLQTVVAVAQGRAINWLERNLRLIELYGSPYEIAIVAYALMLSKTPSAEAAFGYLLKHSQNEGGYTYWGKESIPPIRYKMENQKPFLLPRLPYTYDASNVETTSLALLVYVARREIVVDSIAKWLNSQRLTDGGWASTQDTIWATKALIEYTNRNRLRDVSKLTVTVEATSLPGQRKILHVDNRNIAKLQRIEIPHAWGTVKVLATGAGYAILQMSVQYNVDIKKFQTQPPVRAFSLTTNAYFFGRNQSHITYHSCQSWTNLNESIRSGMAVLDVTIPTGYFVHQQKLDHYVLARHVRNLERARYLGRNVHFYFTYLDNQDICVNFTVERWYPVANMSRYLPIRVYDYYAPERFNETIFDSSPTYVLNICEVCGSSQCPYCPIYSAASALSSSVFLIVYSCMIFVAIREFWQMDTNFNSLWNSS